MSAHHQFPVQYKEVSMDDAGMRLDNFLLKYYRGVPKARIYRAVRKGEVRVDASRCRASQRLERGSTVRVPPLSARLVSSQQGSSHSTVPVLYEDDCVLVVDKPSGMDIQGGGGSGPGLLNALAPRDNRYYLVHRLDKMVSGCVVVAKSRDICQALQAQWHSTDCVKKYEAVVFASEAPNYMQITSPLEDKSGNAQNACSFVYPRCYSAPYARVCVEIHTGRNHQN